MRLDPQPQGPETVAGEAPPAGGELADEQLEQVAGGLSLPGFGKS
jgi:hypothetical protein